MQAVVNVYDISKLSDTLIAISGSDGLKIWDTLTKTKIFESQKNAYGTVNQVLSLTPSSFVTRSDGEITVWGLYD